MNVNELLDLVGKRGGDIHSVYRGEGNPEDRYAVVKEAGRWIVFYTERGERFDVRSFDLEDAACEYLLHLLESDDTVWASSQE